MSGTSNRRSFIRTALLSAAGVSTASCLEERILLAAVEEQKQNDGPQEDAPETPQPLPCGQLGNLKISRMVMGGNLIGGWAHARDLIYVSQLFKAYNTESKVFETLALAERHGINTIQIDPACQDVVEKYKRERGSKLQTIVCVHVQPDAARMKDDLRQLIDKGATTIYTHGGFTDNFVRNQQIDVIGNAVELVKREGLMAGIGGHSLENVIASENARLEPDYYVKTLHKDTYWSATPKESRKEFCWQMGPKPEHDEYHDNIYCLNPDQTIEYMQEVKKPWFAFKVLAAGAVQPRIAFSHALKNGADFIIVGMFDFHVAANAKLVRETLAKIKNRKRAWHA